MKCTKIVLSNRTNSCKPKEINKNGENAVWITTGHHGYSYKLSAKTKQFSTPRGSAEPQLTITTLMFPENINNCNTGSSLDRWSRKTPTLVSAKRRNYSSKKNLMDDEYEFYYPVSDILSESKLENEDAYNYNPELLENGCDAFDFKDYYVSADIEELVLKSQRATEERCERKCGKKRKNKKKGAGNDDKGDSAKSKRNKFKKTIRFSLSKPPSPETEQVIRVDVTSNVSFDDTAEIEEVIKGNPSLAVNKDYKRNFKANRKELSEKPFDNNNNERQDNLGIEGVEEEFLVKCRQLALTKKKR
ncbi:uncharacterized protein [Euwallacea fornicatus]